MPSFIKNSNALPRVTAIFIYENIILCFNKKYCNGFNFVEFFNKSLIVSLTPCVLTHIKTSYLKHNMQTIEKIVKDMVTRVVTHGNSTGTGTIIQGLHMLSY